MSARGPYHHDARELAGCPLWVGAFLLAGWGVLQIGVGEMSGQFGDVHVIAGSAALGVAAWSVPFWRRNGLALALASSFLVFQLVSPRVPFHRVHAAMLLVAVSLFLVAWWLYRSLGEGAELRPFLWVGRSRWGAGRRDADDLAAPLPRYLRRFGLTIASGEADLKRAYREQARTLHPDHGGDPAAFRTLQVDLELARQYLRARSGRSGRRPTQEVRS